MTNTTYKCPNCPTIREGKLSTYYDECEGCGEKIVKSDWHKSDCSEPEQVRKITIKQVDRIIKPVPDPHEPEQDKRCDHGFNPPSDCPYEVMGLDKPAQQTDTSTPEGHRAVCEHVWNGGEAECAHGNSWRLETFPPSNWSANPVRRIRPPQPARTPAVDEVWEDSEGERFMVYEVSESFIRICQRVNGAHDRCPSLHYFNTEYKYIGKLDLSLLNGGGA